MLWNEKTVCFSLFLQSTFKETEGTWLFVLVLVSSILDKETWLSLLLLIFTQKPNCQQRKAKKSHVKVKLNIRKLVIKKY